MAKVAKVQSKPAVYVVQTWDKARALTNSYEVTIGSPEELRQLRAFLRNKHAHVLVSRKAGR